MSNNAVDSTRAINALLQKKNFIKLPDITGQSLIDCHTISSIESTMWSIIDQYCKIVINEKAGVESTKEIGGCLCMLSRHRKEVLMMPNPIGYFPGISRTDYDLESLGNAIQLHEGDKKTCNGALKTEHVIPSFFGLPKSSDDIIIVLVLAVCKGWMTISQSLKITKNKHFLPLYKSVSKQ